jgi:hypothetical protein
MPSQGPNSPSSAGTVNRGSNNWSGTANVTASDDTRATHNCTSSITQCDILIPQGFGFSIPSGSTIDGIIVEVEDSVANASNTVMMDTIRLSKSSTGIGENKGDNRVVNSTTDSYKSYGSATDTWGYAWTAGEINTNTGPGAFSVQLGYTWNSGGTSQIRVDHVRITVYYTEPQGQPTWTRLGGLWVPQRHGRKVGAYGS